MNSIIFVSNNKETQEYVKSTLGKYNINVSFYEDEVSNSDVSDIEYIAKIKAIKAYKESMSLVISSETGFYIKNFPGIYDLPGIFINKSFLSNIGIKGLLEIMKKNKKRECFFAKCVVYYDGNEFKAFYSILEGYLSYYISGECKQQGFSDLYNIFIPKNFNKTLNEMPDYEKNMVYDNYFDAVNEFALWYNEAEDLILRRNNNGSK